MFRAFRVPAVLAFAVAAPAHAQDAPAEPAIDPTELTRDTVSVGVGPAIVPSYEGSDDYRVIPGAVVRGRISGFNFATEGTRLFVDVVRDSSGPGWEVTLGPAVGLTLNRSSGVGDRRVEALGNRKVALDVGGYAGVARTGMVTSDYDRLAISVTYLHDVSGVYRSAQITPAISYGTPLSRKVYVALSAAADHVGDGYADTYFSVSPAGSARSSLPVYRARGGWKSWSLGAMFNVSLTGDLTHGLSFAALGRYERLVNDFAASPVTRIAGSPNQWFGTVGLGYTF